MESYEKITDTSSKPFPFICGFFPKGQNLQHVVHDIRPLLQGLGVSHSICWQRESNAGEYDRWVLLSLLVFAYNF
jgi:hypothetical protein